MSMPASPNGDGGAPVGGSFLPLAFIGVVVLAVGAVLAVFVPGWLVVFGVLFLLVGLHYIIWGRWLHKAIEAEEAAEAEFRTDKGQDEFDPLNR